MGLNFISNIFAQGTLSFGVCQNYKMLTTMIFHSTQMKFRMYLRWAYNSINLYLISFSFFCTNEVFFTKIMFMSVSCKYWQGISKSWKLDINHCVVEDYCSIVNYVVDTFKGPMSCQLIFLDHLLILYFCN
jgi:hypothetical protein